MFKYLWMYNRVRKLQGRAQTLRDEARAIEQGLEQYLLRSDNLFMAEVSFKGKEQISYARRYTIVHCLDKICAYRSAARRAERFMVKHNWLRGYNYIP